MVALLQERVQKAKRCFPSGGASSGITRRCASSLVKEGAASLLGDGTISGAAGGREVGDVEHVLYFFFFSGWARWVLNMGLGPRSSSLG